MRKCKLIISLLSLLIVVLLIFLFITSRYCVFTNLQFDSSEFNNIATPIISLIGVIGLVYTIYISLVQIRFTRSEKYYSSYLEKTDNISKEENSDLMFPNIKVLDFLFYVDNIYETLKQDNSYMSDLEKFKNGEDT